MKQKKMLNSDLKTEHKETTNRSTVSPTTEIDIQATTTYIRLGRVVT